MNLSNETATSLPTYEDVVSAAQILDGVAHRTPVLTSRTLNDALGAQVFFKCESFQRAGAFKFRGAYHALAKLSPEQRKAGVVTYSSGNHAQAIALSGQLLGIPPTIVMPHDAPVAKREATEGYGARIVSYDRYTEKREEIAAQLALKEGLTIVPPFNHPDVIAGQGTTGKELFEQAGPLDALLVCLGGGGLLSGCSLAAKALSPDCLIFGVEPEAGNDAQRSLRGDKIVTIDPPHTLADGAATTALGDLTFGIMRQTVDDVFSVSDASLVRAMQWFAQRMKLVVEPTGCLAAAAVLEKCLTIRPGMRIGVVVSGGNVDLTRYGQLLAGSINEG